jgi:protein gp37
MAGFTPAPRFVLSARNLGMIRFALKANHMADRSSIEWTDATWNPVTGCTKISAGCDNCYAERFSERFRGTPGHPFQNGFDLTLRPARLEQPLHWRRPRMIFVNSMSDLFHKNIPSEFIRRVFDTMENADWHQYQLLTKRSSLMLKFLKKRYGSGRGPAHMWFGVSLEDGSQLSRVRHLQQAPAGVRFLSIEPLIGPVGELNLEGIDWVIVGGESGPGSRPMERAWVRSICAQRRAAGNWTGGNGASFRSQPLRIRSRRNKPVYDRPSGLRGARAGLRQACLS